MNVANLWVEITISGLIYSSSIIMLSMTFLGISNFNFIVSIKDYLAIISIVTAIISYIVGIVMHRFLQVILSFIKFIVKKIYNKANNIVFPDLNKVIIWQYGSERLHKEYDYQFNFLSLLTSLNIGIPLFGISLNIWLINNNYMKASNLVFIIFLPLSVLLIISLFKQRSIYSNFIKNTIEELEFIKEKK